MVGGDYPFLLCVPTPLFSYGCNSRNFCNVLEGVEMGVQQEKKKKKKTAEVGIDTAKFCYVLLGFAAFC